MSEQVKAKEKAMIVIALGRWSSASGRYFVRERIYKNGYEWTPFVKVNWRFPWKWRGKWRTQHETGWAKGTCTERPRE